MISEMRVKRDRIQRGELRTDPMATVKSKLEKIGFFTPIAFDSSGLETNISYRNHKTFFSDLWTLQMQSQNFIIGGVKISCQMFDMRAQPVLDVVESCETIA